MDHDVRKLQRTFEDVRHDLSVAEIARVAKNRVEQRLNEAKQDLDPKLDASLDTPPPQSNSLSGTVAHGSDDPVPDAAPPVPPAESDSPPSNDKPAA